MQEHHYSKGQRSLQVSPNELYAAFKRAANVLPLPNPPTAKNHSQSTEADNIAIYRQQALQIAQQRYKPTAMDENVVDALHLINQKVIQIGSIQKQNLDTIQDKVDQLHEKVDKLAPAKRQPHIKQVQRDAFTPQFIQTLHSKLRDPSHFPLYKQRNHIAIQILYSCGVRCKETRDLTVQQLLNLSKEQEIFKTKTNRKRIITIGTTAVGLLQTALLCYIDTVKHTEKLKGNLGPLWLNFKTKNTMHHKSILRSINKELDEVLAESLGLQNAEELQGQINAPHISSHLGRITFVTKLLKSGTDIDTVRQMVGHSRIDTTHVTC